MVVDRCPIALRREAGAAVDEWVGWCAANSEIVASGFGPPRVVGHLLDRDRHEYYAAIAVDLFDLYLAAVERLLASLTPKGGDGGHP